jgi:hypothetical protein
MGHQDGKQMHIALLIVAAALATVLAVMEAMADYSEAPAGPGELRVNAGVGQTIGAASAWLSAHLRNVDSELRRNNVSAAERAWHDAYVVALDSPRWEGMLAVGDAALRVGDRTRARLAARARARQAYLAALFRARDERSRDGLYRVAGAFAALGDTALAIHCVRIAESPVTSEGLRPER